MSDGYLWIKAVHIMAVIAWMAGLFYLPRLFVYHAQEPVGSPTSALFKIMERRLMKAIMTPAAVLAWAMGLWLAFTLGFHGNGWLHAKLALVVILTGVHIYLERCRRAFAMDQNQHTHKFYRLLNEVPTLLMLVIVPLVVLKPF